MQDFYAAVYRNIETHGHHLMAVSPTEDDPCVPFIYTIGMSLGGLPELIALGLHPADGGVILNELCDRMRRRKRPFLHDTDVPLGGARPVRIVNALPWAQREYTVQVGRALRLKTYQLQQVLICDRDGKFPGDPGCAAPYANIPRLDGFLN